MTYRTSLVVGALFTALFIGCSKSPTHGTLTSSASITIEPGISVGSLHSGMKKQDVSAILGEPSHEQDGVLEYHDLGIALLPEKGGSLDFVVCSGGNAQLRPFAGHTKEGIGIGSSRADVISAYGEPTTIEARVPDNPTLVYKTRGIKFRIKEDKVSEIAVSLKP